LDLDRNKAILFDPAFAGENPVALCDTKALAHIGYMVMGGMYFDPKLNSPKYRYDEETNTMFASIKFNETPLYNEHEAMALSIIENRVLPLFENAKLNGADTEKEISRLSDSLSACPLLTINIPKLLDSKDGRGTGLLPLVLMLNELKGFPSIEYLSEKLNEL
jgi:dihydroorotate dehydrogenase